MRNKNSPLFRFQSAASQSIEFFLCIAFIYLFLLCRPCLAQGHPVFDALEGMQSRVQQLVLSNGLRVILYNRGQAPVFAGVVAVRVGGADEVVGHTGISHMLEHMAFKGTPDLGTKDYAKEKKLLAELERVALQVDWAKGLTKDQARQWKAIIGQLDDLWVNEGWVREYKIRGAQGLNATTSKDLTNYMLELPKSAFEFWCWMESERVIRPVMRQFYRERDVVMEERRMRFDSSPEGKLYEMLLSTAYSAHSYRYPVIGYEFDIRDLTATATAAFQKAYYVPENIVVALVGDVDKERDASIIEKYFGRIPIGTRPAYPHAVEPTQEGLREVVYKVDASRLTLLAYRKPNYPHPDDAKIGIMSEVLAGSRLSPLYKELVEKRRLASDVGAYEGPGNQYPNLLMFQMTPLAPHDNSDVLSAFHEILEKFKSNPPSEEELANAKRRVAMSYLGALEDNMSLALDLASSELLHGGWRASITWLKDAMEVSASDVQDVARRYLVKTSETIARIEPGAAREIQ